MVYSQLLEVSAASLQTELSWSGVKQSWAELCPSEENAGAAVWGWTAQS